MRKIGRDEISRVVGALIEKAERWLPPDVAMMIECAYDSEGNPQRRALFGKLYEDFIRVGLNGGRLSEDTVRVIVLAFQGADVELSAAELERGARDAAAGTALTLLTAASPSPGLRLTVLPVGADFDKHLRVAFLVERTYSGIARFAAARMRREIPFIAGVGLADTEEEAVQASRIALARPVDTVSADLRLKRLLRDIRTRMDAGRGEGAAALHVAIENKSENPFFCAVQTAGCILRRAAAEL